MGRFARRFGLRFGTLMAALNRQFFLNKPYGVGGKSDKIP